MSRLMQGLKGTSLLIAIACVPAHALADARALDGEGRVFTVGNWATVAVDGLGSLRVTDSRFLGWELRDGAAIVSEGMVPGAEALGIDEAPAVSRNPVTGEIWLVWSRQDRDIDPREIAIARFGSQGFVHGSFAILASGPANQMAPAVIHDATGHAFVAWVEASLEAPVRLLSLTPEGESLQASTISEGRSTANGPPSLGIDAFGHLFASYVGTHSLTGQPAVFVLSPTDQPVALNPISDPILILGIRGALPMPSGVAPSPQGPTVNGQPGVTLTVLGGTPVAWWMDGQLFRYVAQVEAGWSQSQIQTIDLEAGMTGSVADALALLEARFRRVTEFGVGSPVAPPVLPVAPTLPGTSLRHDNQLRRP